MKIKSALATEMSGSLGGLVASHNRGGLYLRARAIPVNPNTVQQQVIRSAVAQLTSAWLAVLTLIQRTAWDAYALQVSLPDRLGEPRNVGGIAMYVRSNVPRIQAGEPRIDQAPTTFNLGEFSALFIPPPLQAGQSIDVSLIGEPPTPDEWLSEDGAFMFVYTARAQNQSVNFFKGPYRFITKFAGDSAVPLAYPLITGAAFPFLADQKVFIRLNVSRADGRLGTPQFLSEIAVNAVGGSSTDSDQQPHRSGSAKRNRRKAA